jgi:hypothetical protein
MNEYFLLRVRVRANLAKTKTDDVAEPKEAAIPTEDQPIASLSDPVENTGGDVDAVLPSPPQPEPSVVKDGWKMWPAKEEADAADTIFVEMPRKVESPFKRLRERLADELAVSKDG